MAILQTLLVNIILAVIIAHIMKVNINSDVQEYNEVPQSELDDLMEDKS
jgi:hypothetical protein